MKRLLMSLTVMATLLCALVLTASATIYGDFEFEVLSDGTLNIISYNTNGNTSVTFPATINGETVSTVTFSLTNCTDSEIGTITLEEGITTILGSPSSGIPNQWDYVELNLPSTLTTIGDYAFSTDALSTPATIKKLVIPEGVTSIGGRAFQGVSILDLTLPSTLTVLGAYSLYRTPIRKISLPSGLTNIGERALSGTDLTSITIPNSVQSIGARAFQYCNQLVSVDMGDGLIYLGSSAFAYCESLSKVVCSDSLLTIGDSAFNHCYALSELYLPANITVIQAIADSDDLTSLTDIYFAGTQAQWDALGYDDATKTATLDTSLGYTS